MFQIKRVPMGHAGYAGRNLLQLAIPVFLFILVVTFGAPVPSFAAAAEKKPLAATPPMGWNDWAQYQCGYTGNTILDNARALVSTGLAALGYNTVTIDDCWMLKERNAKGNLQPDPKRFPNGMKAVADSIHGMGLKFGIYEDSGSETCGGFAGSGQPQGGGQTHFLQDARLFASWGVDYLKLDGCNVYVAPGESKEQAYHMAYAAEHEALKQVDRPIVFSESAPAYFQDTPEWYDVLSWIGKYGQLWREGTDMANYHAHATPEQLRRSLKQTRYQSMLWNYSYNQPLGRFQKPGNWNDADFIIAGGYGMGLPESRTQMTLWSMMSAPLILSSDISKLSPKAIAIVGNKDVIAIDQDPRGKMATLVRRTPQMDVLFKRLSGGDVAVAVMNHGKTALKVDVTPADVGFAASSSCTFDAKDLWNGKEKQATSSLEARVSSHDAIIWRVHPSSECGAPSRTGAITMVNAVKGRHRINGYTSCLGAAGSVESCTGVAAEKWTVTKDGALRSTGDKCLAVVNGKPVMQACRTVSAQQWRYTLKGNLVNNGNLQCLTAAGPKLKPQSIKMQVCGRDQESQIWSLPN